MIAPARTAALSALRAVLGHGHDLPSALARTRASLRDERDRALTAEIVTGTLRWLRSLDFLIEHFSSRPLQKLDPDVLTILRLSLYQVLHLQRVPAAAVVDDAVNLARAARKPSASGFVNAVLRSTLRQRHRLPLPPRPHPDALRSEQLAYLGVTLSHPEWLVARWLDRHGFDATEAWVRFNNETPALTVRVNELRASVPEAAEALRKDGIEVEPLRMAPAGLQVVEGNPLRRPPDGLVFVQDEASQLVPLVVDAQPGERVLDLCASPGNKTVAMASAMRDRGLVVASDVRPRRMQLLRETVRQSGARSVRLVQVDVRGAVPVAATFDRVLVDAPCSGLGTIRRDPDIRWRRREDELARFAAGELEILERAAAAVRPGGRLVYATCSSEPDENEAVADRFLDTHPEFGLVDLRHEPAAPVLARLADDRGMFRTLPFRDGLEAFYAAAFRRR